VSWKCCGRASPICRTNKASVIGPSAMVLAALDGVAKLRRVSFSASLAPRARCAGFQQFLRWNVHNDVRRADEFAGPLYLTGSAKAGESCQLVNAVDNCLGDIPASGGIVLLDVFKCLTAASNSSAASVVHRTSLTIETDCRYG
jgi:hypothetical protein